LSAATRVAAGAALPARPAIATSSTVSTNPARDKRVVTCETTTTVAAGTA
jgi:hypothetical protein